MSILGLTLGDWVTWLTLTVRIGTGAAHLFGF